MVLTSVIALAELVVHNEINFFWGGASPFPIPYPLMH